MDTGTGPGRARDPLARGTFEDLQEALPRTMFANLAPAGKADMKRTHYLDALNAVVR